MLDFCVFLQTETTENLYRRLDSLLRFLTFEQPYNEEAESELCAVSAELHDRAYPAIMRAYLTGVFNKEKALAGDYGPEIRGEAFASVLSIRAARHRNDMPPDNIPLEEIPY